MKTALPALDRTLLENLERALSAKRSDRLACGPGCTECCMGPFPINALDAARLREGLSRLPPARASAIVARATEQAGLYGELPADPDAQEAFFTRHHAVPCPALDPATGTCELYEWRPLACRTYGPPVRIGEQDLPPCRLCFVGCSAAEIDAARVVVDPEGIEDRILDAMGDDSETIIALVLRDRSS